jgi:RNA polymerase sigma-70 factor (ECF subfamily)
VNATRGPDDVLVRAAAGDERAFAEAVAPYERSLFRHCYRMLGSGADAEEALQDALLRAWRRLPTFRGDGPFGGWLHRIATNVCLDRLRGRKARVDAVQLGPPARPDEPPRPSDLELMWVEPVDDERLGTVDPHNELMRREDVSLAFVAALQRLAPRQRACLLLHDVVGFTHAEVCEALDLTPAAVNSLLFRAREAARPRPEHIDIGDAQLRALLVRYLDAWRLADMDAFLAVVSDDVRLSMPPLPGWYDGRAAVGEFLERFVFAAARPYGILLQPGWCNGQPAFATYEPNEEGVLVASGVQVLDVEDRDGHMLVTAIASYRDPELARACGFPITGA